MRRGVTTPPAERRSNQVIVSGPIAEIVRLADEVRHWSKEGQPNTKAVRKEPPYQVRDLATFQGSVGQVKAILVVMKPASADDCDRSVEINDRILSLAKTKRLMGIKTEPNCTVGSPSGWRGDPYTWEGDPYTWEGDPYTWEGDPYAQGEQTKANGMVAQVQPVGENHYEGESMFAHQNAFQRIRLAEHGKRRPELAQCTGSNVRVAIFDTCPPKESIAALPMGAPTWLHPHVTNPPLAPGEFSDHGLFIASLVNFVAPAAEIHLYQVLEGNTFGDTAQLLTALAAFINDPDDRPAVINLSLGSMCGCGGGRMPALEGLLWHAVGKGMVICAAAGNRGRKASKTSVIPPAQMPASLPYVIAVAASNEQEIRASYSQRGDIAAPGGETTGVPGPTGFDDMIGLGTASTSSGYIRMDCGTSFSTPLVVGVAALVLEDLAKRGVPADSGMWRSVYQRLALGCVPPVGEAGTMNTTGMGAGIIRVSGRNTLRGC
jgi:hypothetical protein